MARKLKIITSGVFGSQNMLIYNDWYDFADYVKQENIAGRSVTIYHWEYTDG